MANKQDEERLRREKLELLKMKQGIIEESEIIPETGARAVAEVHGFKKVTNFLYLNKWIIIPAVFAAALVLFLAVQFFSREKADIEIILAVTSENSELLAKADIVEKTLEKYCPDFDGNGNVHVSVETIDLSLDDAMTQYADIERKKLSLEFRMCDRPLAVCDKGFISEYIPKCDLGYEIYTNFTEVYSDDMLFAGKGVLSDKTDVDFPDGTLFCVRALPANSKAQEKDVIERRERALIVLQNLVEGNAVNP